MTLEEAKKEMESLMAQLEVIQKKSETETVTAKFLMDQVNKLAQEGRLETTTDERREQIIKEMEALRGRMSYEERHVKDDFPKMERIIARVKEIAFLHESGQLT